MQWIGEPDAAAEVGLGASVEFGHQGAGGGDHEGVGAGLAGGEPGVEDLVGAGAEVADVDAVVVEVEAERLGVTGAEGEAGGAFGGVCEPDERIRSRVEHVPALQGVPWLTRDALLGDGRVAMVAVESTVPRLLEYAHAVIDAGKHLHLDKPAGASLPDFETLLAKADNQGRLVQMGYMFRYNPGFDLVRRAVREGWLGHVYSIHASMCTGLGGEKRASIAWHPGGIMFELGCHLIDMVHLLLGPPAKVTPFLRHDSPAGDGLADNTLAILEYDGAMAVIETAAMEINAFATRRFKVCGTGGTLILEPLEPPAARLCLSQAAGGFKAGWQAVPLEDLPRHVRDFDDLARCIRGEARFAYSTQHDLSVQKTLLQVSIPGSVV